MNRFGLYDTELGNSFDLRALARSALWHSSRNKGEELELPIFRSGKSCPGLPELQRDRAAYLASEYQSQSELHVPLIAIAIRAIDGIDGSESPVCNPVVDRVRDGMVQNVKRFRPELIL